MGTYTESIEDKRYEISTGDDNYIEELQEVAEMFRNFDEALDVFLVEHGYGSKRVPSFLSSTSEAKKINKYK